MWFGDAVTRAVSVLLMIWRSLRDKIWAPGSTIPEPCYVLDLGLKAIFGNNKLKILEFLFEHFFSHGLFRYEDKIYIIDAKYCQAVINRSEKGGEKYLSNSPLENSFLGSPNKSPETRRSISAIFRKSNMEERGLLMIKDIEKMIQIISKNTMINVNEVTLKLALDIVGHVLIDVDLEALDGKRDKILECMMTILHKAYALGEITYDSEEFLRASEIFDKLTTNILEDALSSGDARPGVDVNLPQLLHTACGFDEAKDNLKLFLMAGSETTAATIPVVLHVLASRPDIQTELQTEADEFVGILRKAPGSVPPKLESAMKEVLRVYPIAPFISRHTDSELQLGDVHVPAGSDLRIFTWGIHRSSFMWEDSKDFKPDRFLKLQSSTNNQSYFWIPFGAGPRICIGQHMAWVELRLALTFLLHHFTFFAIPETPELQFCVDWEHAVVHPDKDIILGVRARSP
ncbi:cytochrome P450 3A41-like [Haliotis cracherodii]|uniref:cytochrome P450 3A41-like n=1 Tax=Haliotis cracherodii TaxID=6455 RepID=UPI0039E73627